MDKSPGPLVVSLLTDFGLADGFVGALHSVLRARVPQVPIVDLTHEVRPQDVRGGSFALARAAPYLAPGVVLAVVDPGVGTARRPLAARAKEGCVTFVGPDNGLLVPALEALGGPVEVVELQNSAHRLSSPGPTFAGRDIFAPAAAHLAAGGDLAALGPRVRSTTLVRLPSPVCMEHDDGSLETEVTWVDRYGNAQISVGSDALPGLGGPGGPGGVIDVEVVGRPGARWPARIVLTYADLAPGELGALVDSYGYVALCLNAASAAEQLGIKEQDLILLKPVGRQ
ncbi:MAG TPA: SAM-dependent chlorinase/fluorinase [Acidimicrobiales bacterium]|nr:SAM-dependent chlorinase/fluorinase [Acidimicrobiales bacterium]